MAAKPQWQNIVKWQKIETATSSPKRSIASQTDSASPGAALASTCAKSRSSFAYSELGCIFDARTLFWGGGGGMRNGPTAPPQAAHNRLLKLFYFNEKYQKLLTFMTHQI